MLISFFIGIPILCYVLNLYCSIGDDFSHRWSFCVRDITSPPSGIVFGSLVWAGGLCFVGFVG